MTHTDYLRGTAADRADIIDFANCVFSQTHVPHDFKALLPKVYADEAAGRGYEDWHFLAKQEGRIRGLVACKPVTLHVQDNVLMAGAVGTVSVHLYARGEGHMKKLMTMMIDDGRARKYDFLFLGGQRQRYNYFGFDNAGMVLSCPINATNVRHALSDVDASAISFSELTEARPDEVDYAWRLSKTQTVYGERERDEFLAIMHSWKSTCRLIRNGGVMAGYIMGEGRELVLEDEALLPAVIKALFELEPGRDAIKLQAAPFQRERVELLSRICGSATVDMVELINVLNWKNMLSVLMQLKASYARLEDGTACLRVDDQTVTISVKDGVPSVAEGGENPIELEHLQAQRLIFGIERLLICDDRFHNWFPLPFNISTADTF